jgi:ethanolamine ammonia-lyase large subunit
MNIFCDCARKSEKTNFRQGQKKIACSNMRPLPARLNTMKTLNVVVLEAIGLPIFDHLSRNSDPYCIVRFASQEKQSRVVPSSLSPVWFEEFSFTASECNSFSADIWNKNPVIDDFMCSVTVQLDSQSGKSVTRWFDCFAKSGGSAGRIRLRYVWVDGLNPQSLSGPALPMFKLQNSGGKKFCVVGYAGEDFLTIPSNKPSKFKCISISGSTLVEHKSSYTLLGPNGKPQLTLKKGDSNPLGRFLAFLGERLRKPTAKDQLCLSVISGTSLKAADINGKSDPYCTVNIKWSGDSENFDHSFQTRTIMRTLDPKWGAKFSIFVEEFPITFTFSVFDKDFIDADDLLGHSVYVAKSLDDLKGTHDLHLTEADDHKNLTQGYITVSFRTILATDRSDFDMEGFVRADGTPMTYQQIVGSANEFKEGDAAIGVAAIDEHDREIARAWLSKKTIEFIHENPLYEDDLQKLIWANIDENVYQKIKKWTIAELKQFLLEQPEEKIKEILPGLNSDIIACVVRGMNLTELGSIGQKIYNPIPGTKIGAEGYLSTRLQPNSPTDDLEDIFWQVLNGFAFGVGDLMLGNNPVDSTPDNIASIDKVEKEILETLGIIDHVAWCCLGHIDISEEISTNPKYEKDLIGLSFQSIAGTVDANKTFGISNEKMIGYAEKGHNRFGLYLETGQGSDFTNNAAHGVDMVTLESRKYGFARVLQKKNINPYTVVNDVAGFIGPEVFRTKEQLVRAVHEDMVMGKLHSLCIGSDICSTLHMEISLSELDWCLNECMKVRPAFLITLPTKNDPMLGYLTTAYQDYLRLRETFNLKVDDKMMDFFRKIEIFDRNGDPTEHTGDVLWVYYQYCLAKGDTREEKIIRKEGEKKMRAVTNHGVPLSIGHEKKVWEMKTKLKEQTEREFQDGKVCLQAVLPDTFFSKIENSVVLKTQATSRDAYIHQPPLGEILSKDSEAILSKIQEQWIATNEFPDVQIVISDGLNANALTDPDHLQPYLDEIHVLLKKENWSVSSPMIVINGRVRVAYQIGHILFSNAPKNTHRTIINIIGERPGTIHHNYSVYLSSPDTSVWATNMMDHNLARVISGISDTALLPKLAAKQTIKLIKELNSIN